MAYPGNPELSAQAQERVMTAFRQAVAKLQEGQREEATISLEFVLRLDPAFAPAVNLKQQLSSGAEEIDLGDIIGQLQAPTTETINELLVEAVEEFNQRNFVEAKEKVEKVLIELPGHQEARQLLGQVTDALKVESQVGQFLAQAREALTQGDAQEAANFVMMAQALDPHHSGIAPTLQEINERGGLPQPGAAAPTGAETIAFETSDAGADGFSVQFDELAQEAPELLVEPAQLEGDFVPPGEAAMPAPAEPQPPADAPWDAGAAEQPAVELPPPPPSPEPEAPEVPAGDDLFAESPAPAPPPSPEPPPAQEAPPDADDISDLFEADDELRAAVPTTEGAPEATGSPTERLMGQGEAAFESGDYLSAIDSWSRIYLIDPSDQAVGTRISEAKSRLEDQERRIEHMLFEAQDAKLTGENDKALELANEILALQPNQIEALELRQSLGAAGEQPPPPPPAPGLQEMPDLDADLFDEQPAAAEDVMGGIAAEAVEFAWEEEERKILGLPVKTVALIGGGVVVVAVLLWLASSIFMGSKPPEMDVYELRAQAEELFRQGEVAEALRMVEDFESSDPADQQVVNRLREKYQQALATPTPTPLPVQLMAAEKLREHGYFFHAYAETMSGLKKNPEDSALLELKELIEEDEPMVSVLQSALANANFQSAVGISRDLLERYPNQEDLVEVQERSLFNAALAELRAYNLTGAEAYLRELEERRPSDEVVDRILEFIGKYKARPVDMQLKVFIGSIDPRSRRTIEIASTAPEAAPDGALQGGPVEATPTPPPDAAPSEPA
jgi:tetratricopeptide (TPR) repeat protein